MRKLSEVTAPILPRRLSDVPRSFDRRKVRAVINSLTCLVLVKHGESPTQLFVSDDGDAVGAVWVDRMPVLIDPKDRGPFLVVTMTRTLAQQKGFAPVIRDWDAYTPAERLMLKDAVETAKRNRMRLSGQKTQCAAWRSGNVFA